MCGRYALYGPRKRSRDEDAYFSSIDSLPATWNAAPTHTMPIARLTNGDIEQLSPRWGLLPSWSKEEKVKFSTHNARCETVATAATYRGPYRRKQRCLVPAAGFYEWQVLEGGAKQPFHMVGADRDLLVFAGLWDSWRRPNGETLTTFTIVTTEPSEMMSGIHDRMPVILDPAHYAEWLEADDPKELMRPAHNERLFAYPVGAAVGKVANNDPSLIEPVDEADRAYLAPMLQ